MGRRPVEASKQTGSDNLIIGDEQHFSSYYSLLGGYQNTDSAPNSDVLGLKNTASGAQSSVSGGDENTASGEDSSISAGVGGQATAKWDSVSGGFENKAKGTEADTVGGGYDNEATGPFQATVGGGSHNVASASYGSVSGGTGNTASGESAFVGGGLDNKSTGFADAILGGDLNSDSGNQSTVSGGEENTASAGVASVTGGYKNKATGSSSTVSGGQENKAVGGGSSVSGGGAGEAYGSESSVTGGHNGNARGFASTIGGGLFELTEDEYGVAAMRSPRGGRRSPGRPRVTRRPVPAVRGGPVPGQGGGGLAAARADAARGRSHRPGGSRRKRRAEGSPAAGAPSAHQAGMSATQARRRPECSAIVGTRSRPEPRTRFPSFQRRPRRRTQRRAHAEGACHGLRIQPHRKRLWADDRADRRRQRPELEEDLEPSQPLRDPRVHEANGCFKRSARPAADRIAPENGQLGGRDDPRRRGGSLGMQKCKIIVVETHGGIGES